MPTSNYPPVLYTSFIGNKRNRVNDIRRIMTNGAYGRVLESFRRSCVISANLAAGGTTSREDFQAWIRQTPANQRLGQATIHDYLQQAS